MTTRVWTILVGRRSVHTTRENLGLLNGSLIENRTSLHQLDGLRACVGDDGLDCRVSNTLNLDLERAVTLGNIHPGRKSGGNEGEPGEELHGDGLLITGKKEAKQMLSKLGRLPE